MPYHHLLLCETPSPFSFINDFNTCLSIVFINLFLAISTAMQTMHFQYYWLPQYLCFQYYPTLSHLFYGHTLDRHQFTALPLHLYLKHSLLRVPTISHHSTSPTLAILFNISKCQRHRPYHFLIIHFLMYLLPLLILISRIIIMSLQIPLSPFKISVW